MCSTQHIRHLQDRALHSTIEVIGVASSHLAASHSSILLYEYGPAPCKNTTQQLREQHRKELPALLTEQIAKSIHNNYPHILTAPPKMPYALFPKPKGPKNLHPNRPTEALKPMFTTSDWAVAQVLYSLMGFLVVTVDFSTGGPVITSNSGVSELHYPAACPDRSVFMGPQASQRTKDTVNYHANWYADYEFDLKLAVNV
ncbi:hypothetical protein BU23DRAFT_53934 [Bimuria novae-zelandiae CBS 107.79]|uniref:Uncharacterized protein n=1 Tax=Bimuria novae-zelandiae CBS 107.79 TaxID=1447943 RepID=A0A6A5UIA3_9PLEO|nr:hypothetical protein BU23DRAFT_53934 [Bimuria novae-zelandiae CBS 107.79]